MLIHPYHESVLSQLYPGAQHSSNCLEPAVATFETVLPLAPARRPKVIWRLDHGFGGDDNINWLLERNYGVLAKGCSNRRSAQLAQQGKRWYAVRPDKFVAMVPTRLCPAAADCFDPLSGANRLEAHLPPYHLQHVGRGHRTPL